MTIVNRIIYVLINLLWAISLLLIIPSLFQNADNQLYVYLSAFIFLILVIFQFYGAYSLFKKSYLIPIIATAIFILNFDFGGFKLVTDTLLYLKTEVFANGDFVFNFQLDDPSAVINLTFKSFSFEMVGINLLAIMQLGGLIAEKNNKKKDHTPNNAF